MHSEQFLAYNRTGPHGEDRVELTPGIEYDIAAEIDARNSWVEPGERTPDDKDDAVQAAARGFRELFQFCFQDVALDPKGKGMRIVIQRLMSVVYGVYPKVLTTPHCADALTKLKYKEQIKLRKTPGPPVTLAALSRQPHVCCHPEKLKRLFKKFTKQLAAPDANAPPEKKRAAARSVPPRS